MPSRKLDALIAREVMGLEVVGWSTTFVYPEGPAITLGPNTHHTKHLEHENQAPVYVEDCICDIAGEDWDEEERIHDHYFPCLGVVPEYQRDIAAAKQVLDKWRETGDFCCINLKSDHYFVWDISWVRADDESHTEISTGISHPTLEAAITQGAVHAMVLKTITPVIVRLPHKE